MKIIVKKIAITLSFLLSCQYTYAQSIDIDSQNFRQTITMMGGDMERSGRNLQNAVNREEIIDWFIGDIPFNTWRVRYDKRQEYTEGNKNLAYYDDDLATMKMIKDVNPDIKFFATMKSDYHGYSEDNHNNLPTFIYDYAVDNNGVVTGTRSFDTSKYAVFLADYIEYMSDEGVALTYLTTSKEWVQVVTPARAKATIEALQTELAQRGVAMPLLVEAGTWSISQGVNTANNYVSNGTNAYMYGFSSHNLWSEENRTWDEFVNAANNAGKPAFHDESGHGGGGLTLATENDIDIMGTIARYVEKSRMYSAGIEGELFFEVWPRGISEVRANGDYFAKPVFFDGDIPGRRMRSYYVMQKFASNILSYRFIPASVNSAADIYTITFRKDNQMILWVLNWGTTTYSSVDINLSDSIISGGIQNHFWTNDTPISGSTINYSASGNVFSPRIEAGSINAFTFNVSDDSFTPDPTKTYYIDSPVHSLRLASDGSSEDPYTTSISDTGADVEWQFIPNPNGSWHIQRAAGGIRPRLRTDNTEFADMQESSFSGIYTYFDFSPGLISDTHFLTLPDGPVGRQRLQVNNAGSIRFMNAVLDGTWESFQITEVNTTKVVHIKKRSAQGFAIDGNNGGSNGLNILLWSENENNTNQQWNEIDRGDGYYSYQKLGSSYCIDGNNGGANQQNVYLWQCADNNQNQHWQKVSTDSGFFKLIKRNSPGYAVNGGSGGINGQNVNLYDSSNTSHNLQWSIEYVE